MITITPEDPACADASALLDELSATLHRITGSSGSASFELTAMYGAHARFLVARDAQGRAVGCGALRPLEHGIAEVKRMYSRRTQPGIGVALLSALEREAAQLAYTRLRLETRLINTRAVAFYERLGYQRIPNYGHYTGKTEAVCFEKSLAPNHS